MCVSMKRSEMSRTRLYAGEATHGGKYVHVIAYQNRAKSPGPNAMILPFPAKEPLGPENAVDTRAFDRFLEDISNATRIVMRSASYGLKAGAQAAQVFDVGSYTVVLADSPSDVPEAIARVPEAKRPTLSDDVLASYDVNYPGWPLAVCCWSGEIQAEPLLWWYLPRTPEVLFAPALDAHDGHAPRLDRAVEVDHNLSFGTTLRAIPDAELVDYKDKLPPLARELLPRDVVGTRLKKPMLNGDFILGVGTREAYRVAPSRASLSGDLIDPRTARRATHEELAVPLRGWRD